MSGTSDKNLLKIEKLTKENKKLVKKNTELTEKNEEQIKKNKELASETAFSTIHYIITMIFFFLILINIISLTTSTLNMDVNSSDTNAVNAKKLMIVAQVVAYTGEFLILLFIGIAYSYSGSEKNKNYYNKAMSYTGTKDIYSMMRAISFSILMFISIVVSTLCLSAAKEINLSDDPSQYNNQYSLCQEIGRMFFLHFVLFTSIQGASYIYQWFHQSGNAKITPGEIATGVAYNNPEDDIIPSNKKEYDWSQNVN